MTGREALEYLESIVYEEPLYTQRALIVAMSALEKQIPKKIITIRESCNIPFGRCPHCQIEIDKLKNPFYHTDRNCLQLLDWE